MLLGKVRPLCYTRGTFGTIRRWLSERPAADRLVAGPESQATSKTYRN